VTCDITQLDPPISHRMWSLQLSPRDVLLPAAIHTEDGAGGRQQAGYKSLGAPSPEQGTGNREMDVLSPVIRSVPNEDSALARFALCLRGGVESTAPPPSGCGSLLLGVPAKLGSTRAGGGGAGRASGPRNC
jgi:hypothetical protein